MISGHARGCFLTSAGMTARYEQIVTDFPVWSIEDGLGEDDHDGWVRLAQALGGRIQLVGDDSFATNAAVIARAIADQIANASLTKLNQIGTVTETLRDGRVPRGLLRGDGLPPLRRDQGHVHRRPRGRLRLRPAQVRCPGPRRARRQVRPAAGDRRPGHHSRPSRSSTQSNHQRTLKASSLSSATASRSSPEALPADRNRDDPRIGHLRRSHWARPRSGLVVTSGSTVRGNAASGSAGA